MESSQKSIKSETLCKFLTLAGLNPFQNLRDIIIRINNARQLKVSFAARRYCNSIVNFGVGLTSFFIVVVWNRFESSDFLVPPEVVGILFTLLLNCGAGECLDWRISRLKASS